MTIVVVSGIPGSGKTTLAGQLRDRLSIPMISKDVIKESLMDSLGSGDALWARTLGAAAHQVMHQLVRQFPTDAIVEAHFYRGVAEAHLMAMGQPLVQMYCHCGVDIAWNRYRARRDDPDRHPGHRPEHQDELASVGWRTAKPEPLDLPWPLIEVDTSDTVDIDDLIEELTPLLGAG